MSDYVYMLCDDSCEPIDVEALSIERLHKQTYLEKYGTLNWSYASPDDIHEILEDIGK